LKLNYPSDIIENLILTYKIKSDIDYHEISISPPLPNIRLANLSCGNLYEITLSATNQVGFSSNEYLLVKTDGSMPSLVQSTDLIEIISNNFIVLTMSNWIINQCSIISYEIELYPIKNATDINVHRFYRFKSTVEKIQIDDLLANEDYQLNLKVNSQAGETVKVLSFRTTNENLQKPFKTKNPYLIITLTVVAFIIVVILAVLAFILLKFCRLRLKNTGKRSLILVFSKEFVLFFLSKISSSDKREN